MTEINCESCGKNEPVLRNGLTNLLRSGQIDPNEFLLASNRERYKIIKQAFNLEDLPFKQNLQIKERERFEGMGMVVIKPEALQNLDELVMSYLTKDLELEVVDSKEFVYSPEEYWILQGKDLENIVNEFPEGVMLWLLSVTSQSKLIIFKHKTAEEYRNLFRRIDPVGEIDNCVVSSIDPQYVFTELFIRGKSKASVREGLCVPELEKRGFLDMKPGECPATCWDITGEFGRRSFSENARAFNGIHSPRDSHELLSDLVVLSRLFE